MWPDIADYSSYWTDLAGIWAGHSYSCSQWFQSEKPLHTSSQSFDWSVWKASVLLWLGVGDNACRTARCGWASCIRLTTEQGHVWMEGNDGTSPCGSAVCHRLHYWPERVRSYIVSCATVMPCWLAMLFRHAELALCAYYWVMTGRKAECTDYCLESQSKVFLEDCWCCFSFIVHRWCILVQFCGWFQ